MPSTKEKIEEKKAKLLELTTDFSKQYLNEEYNAVIEKLVNKMARKRTVPFETGKIEIWAAAVIHALGTVNFLFDKSSQPYVPVSVICEFFNTNQSTTTQKSKKIRDMFNMTYFDDNFATNTVNQKNPFQNLTMVNGFIVPHDMLQKNVDLKDLESSVSQILGITKLEGTKNYDNRALADLLEVTFEKLMKFYDYLQSYLKFPFPASFEEEVGPLSLAEYDLKCVRLDQEMKVDEFYGILVECRQGKEKVIVPLAAIDVATDNPNFSLIELYQEWFWTYR